MAEIHIVDIDGEQWDIKDLPLTAKVGLLEELHKDYGNIGVDGAIVFCEKNGNVVSFQGEKTFQMELNRIYQIAPIPNDLPRTNERAAGIIYDYESAEIVGIAYRPRNGRNIELLFTSGITTEVRRYVFQFISFQKLA